MAIIRADVLRSISAATLDGTYRAIGTAIQHNWRVFKITNQTDGDLLISFDGTNDNLFVPAQTFTLYDLSTNAPPISVVDNLVLGVGTIIYAKESTAATTKSCYVEGLYARGE